MGDKSAMRPFAKLLWTLVIIVIAVTRNRVAYVKLFADGDNGTSKSPTVNTQQLLTANSAVRLTSRSPLMGSGWPLSEAERQRQRHNVELMRLFTAQADIITDDIASAVDTEYLTLPINNSDRPHTLTFLLR